MTAEHNDTDALMAAITGEPLTQGVRTDDAFMTEYREAEADVALLREQLGLIGHALADEQRPKEKPVPVRAPRDLRRVRRFAFATVAVAAAGTVLVGMGWLLGQSGGASSTASSDSGDKAANSPADSQGGSQDGSPFASPGYLACARLVVEGEVAKAAWVHGTSGRQRITLAVTRAYKPVKTAKQVTFVIEEGAVLKSLHKGEHVLVGLPRDSSVADYLVVGEQSVAREHAGIVRALPEAAAVPCE
ncbi:hypothetical protein [Streptomyces pseudovenezuelae]|uniref:Uncharacterized protein n=1 Tax=Streptomyces pseudovenezuelae TaxID=67350 RepID=A0ABT6LHI5_9ACTN|nr:hypothetical protein [Streptomyces pseudovenezuelae]MDH6215746.1 hypothetical protein [Streptomyces pseudovenezuelae]